MTCSSGQCFCVSTLVTPSVTRGIAAGSAGIVIVNWQVEQNGIIAVSFWTFSCATLQLGDPAAQLELRFDLPSKGVERFHLVARSASAAGCR